MVARLSYFSGSKLFKAAVRYSPAGVVLTFSLPDLIKATVPSFFSFAGSRALTSSECPLLLLSLLVVNQKEGIGYKSLEGPENEQQMNRKY